MKAGSTWFIPSSGCQYWFLPSSHPPHHRPPPPPPPLHLGCSRNQCNSYFSGCAGCPWSSPRPDQWGLVRALPLASPSSAPLSAHPSLSHSAGPHKDSSHTDRSWQKPCTGDCVRTRLQQPACTGPGFAWILSARLSPSTTNDTWAGPSSGPLVLQQNTELLAAGLSPLCQAGGRRDPSASTLPYYFTTSFESQTLCEADGSSGSVLPSSIPCDDGNALYL